MNRRGFFKRLFGGVAAIVTGVIAGESVQAKDDYDKWNMPGYWDIYCLSTDLSKTYNSRYIREGGLLRFSIFAHHQGFNIEFILPDVFDGPYGPEQSV